MSVSQSSSVDEISRAIVNKCLGVQKGEQVVIWSWAHALQYANAIALEVARANATPLPILESDEIFWGYLTSVPEESYEISQKAILAAYEAADAVISLQGPKDPAPFSKVPGGRLNRFLAQEEQLDEVARKKKIRRIVTAIGLVTPERAAAYGFDYNHWQRSFQKSLLVDYDKIASVGRKVSQQIMHAGFIHITSANGTDLSFQVVGRKAHVHDGVLDKTDIQQGSLNEDLPVGYVDIAPVETSAKGVVKADHATILMGKLVDGLEWDFQNGMLVSAHGGTHFDKFTDYYENSRGDRNRIGYFALGLNPRAEAIGYETDRVVAGQVTIGIGRNQDIGGNNDSNMAISIHLRRATVEVDGTTMVSDGRLQI